MKIFIPDNIAQAIWYPVGDDMYIFGVVEKSKEVPGKIRRVMSPDEKYAVVKRHKDGNWDWAIARTVFQGREPSKALAIMEVFHIYLSALGEGAFAEVSPFI